jgi:uncharacterized NAD(P)/FAD-binding protein YdhS
MAGEIDKILWDVAIIGSGFAGALIANELGKGRRRSSSSRQARVFPLTSTSI